MCVCVCVHVCVCACVCLRVLDRERGGGARWKNLHTDRHMDRQTERQPARLYQHHSATKSWTTTNTIIIVKSQPGDKQRGLAGIKNYLFSSWLMDGKETSCEGWKNFRPKSQFKMWTFCTHLSHYNSIYRIKILSWPFWSKSSMGCQLIYIVIILRYWLSCTYHIFFLFDQKFVFFMFFWF